MRYTFELSETSSERADKFIKEHQALHKKRYLGAIGGLISFEFVCTSIGDIANVYCSVCKRRECVNYDEI